MPISEYSSPVQNSLEQVVPLPLDMMVKAATATQDRYNQAQDADSATQTGLASIQALAPGQQDYVAKQVQSYKDDMSQLYDKYNGHLDDPQFQREQRQVINKYKNDPTWNILKTTNQNIQMDNEYASKLRAEGKLVIDPSHNFTGVDANGKPIVYTPGARQVTTLDDWDKMLAAAHQSISYDPKTGRDTNIHNLANANLHLTKSITNMSPEVRDMITAYKQQGMTDDEAIKAVHDSAKGLSSKYAPISRLDEGAIQMNEKEEDRKSRERIANTRANALIEAAKIRAGGKSGSGISDTPYGVSLGAQAIDVGNGLKAYVADESSKDINKKIDDLQKYSGKYFQVGGNDNDDKNVISQGDNKIYTAKAGGFSVNKGMIGKAMNLWVTDGGNLVVGGKDYQVTQKVDKNGREDNYIGNQKVHKQTVIQYTDAAGYNPSDNSPNALDSKSRKNWKPTTYYKFANRDEALGYMGPESAYYEGKDTDHNFNHVHLSVVSKDPNGIDSNDIVKTDRPLSINPTKIQEAAKEVVSHIDDKAKHNIIMSDPQGKQILAKYHNDPGVLNTVAEHIFENRVRATAKAASTKGIEKADFEQLRMYASDLYHDKIYHRDVISKQSRFKNQNKTTGSIDPNANTDPDEVEYNKLREAVENLNEDN